MKATLFAILSILFFCATAQDAVSDQVLQDQQHIENNLIPPITVKGREVNKSTLSALMKKHQVPGVSIGVVKDGQLLWAKGYGQANTKSGQKVDEETLFQAGSISKPLAALAALQLVESGKVQLDEDVTIYLKSWKLPASDFDDKQALTLRHLLTHTGGTTVHGFPGYKDGGKFPSINEVLDGEGNTAAVVLDTEPGSNWRYSGGGYTIMEKVVEDVSGLPLEEYMAVHVFPKLGMTSSTYAQPLSEDLRENASLAYNGKGKIIDKSFHNYPEQAAAGLWTTPTDLAKYISEIQAIRGGKTGGVISPKMAKEMLTKHMGNWGLGPSLRGEGEDLIFGHGGKNAGFTNNMLAHVHKGNGIIVMTSGDNGNDIINALQKNISTHYDMGLSDLKEIEVIEMSAEELDRFTGTYQMEGNPKLKAKANVKNGKLVIRTGSDHELEAIGPLTFTDIKDPETLIFQEDDTGQITGIMVEGPGILLKKIE